MHNTILPQTLTEDLKDWAHGNIDVHIGDDVVRPHQEWTIMPVDSVGSYLGSPYFKITIAGKSRALAATADSEVVTVLECIVSPEQLWYIDQLTDGTYSIIQKVVPNTKEPLVLTAAGVSTITLAKFDLTSDKSRWNFKMP